MNLREAATLALEALENHTAIKHPQQIHYRDSAIEALRAALAEPEQEPVAWMEMVVANLVREGVNKHKARQLAQHFTAPPQRLPLTDEELEVLWDDATDRMEHFCSQYWDFARAIEQAHGIKTAQ